MLVQDLPYEILPQVTLSDKVHAVLQLMDEYQVCEMPVTTEDRKWIGIVKEETLLNVDDQIEIGEVRSQLLKVAINEEDHFIKAVSLAVSGHLDLLPVIDANQTLIGIVETKRLLEHVADFLQVREPGAIIVLEIDALQYAFSEICKIVESNDAQITQLNTSKDHLSEKLLITIKINKMEVSDIVATFQRYEYYVKYYFGEELYVNELKDNYENLIHYLNI